LVDLSFSALLFRKENLFTDPKKLVLRLLFERNASVDFLSVTIEVRNDERSQYQSGTTPEHAVNTFIS